MGKEETKDGEEKLRRLREKLISVDSKITRIKRGLKYGARFTAVQRKLTLLLKRRAELKREIEELEASNAQIFEAAHGRR